MTRPRLASLDSQRYAITQRALGGASTNEILIWLHSQGISASDSTLKRRLQAWRRDDVSLHAAVRPKGTDEAVESAILEFVHTSSLHRKSTGPRSAVPTDEEIRDALKGRFRLTCRQIKDVRLRNQIRRRQKRLRLQPGEALVEAVLECCGRGDELPKDDELAVEMGLLGFETCEGEMRAIRLKYGIKHACRGANRYGRHRAVLHDTPPPPPPEEEEEEEGLLFVGSDGVVGEDGGAEVPGGGQIEEDDDDDDDDVEAEGYFPPPQAVPKLVQDRHLTIVTLDTEATSIVRRIAKPIGKLLYDTVGAGVRQAREPLQVANIATELLESLNIPASCTVSSMYVSNHYIVPDQMFGVWIIPLRIHVESEGGEEEQYVGELLTYADHFIEDQAIEIGQAIYLSKPAAVHTRLTALILSH